MSDFKKALLFATLFELPWILMFIASSNGGPLKGTLLADVAMIVQFVPLSIFSFGWLALFGHGSTSVGPLWAWHCLFTFLVFVLQVAITTPFFFWLVRNGAKGNPNSNK